MSEISNYIPVSRKIFEHNFWCEDRVYSKFEAWLDMIQSTRFEDTEHLIGNRLISVKRGQLLVSLRCLAERWKWSTKKVNRFLELLILAHMVTKETPKETGSTLITVCNYDVYNFNQERRKQQRKQEGNSRETAGKQEGNSNNMYNKENKEKKENKGNNNPPLPPDGGSEGKKNPGFNFSFLEDAYRPVFLEWLEYKAARKERYRTQKSLEACYRKLKKLSESDAGQASLIVEQSMANNWAGLFELGNRFVKAGKRVSTQENVKLDLLEKWKETT